MSRVAIATSSRLGADAAAEVAESGGNAVDCAIAAALATTNTEPGVCALAGGGYVTVWPAGREPVTIDGNVAVPGLGGTPAGAEHGTRVTLAYGGGLDTVVGAAAVAVPGTLAALDTAWQRYGVASWRQLVAPSVRAARDGFPLPSACHYYLQYSGKPIFGRGRDGFEALHDDAGRLRPAGTRIVVPQLADSLDAIARNGARVFYAGELGAAIAAHVTAGGGRLSRRDLESYRAIVREPLRVDLGDWQIATNPPPALGGAVLAAMLLACRDTAARRADGDAVGQLVRVQHAVLCFRRHRLDLADDVAGAVRELLALAGRCDWPGPWTSSSTVHTSAVDADGNACAITASSGYGSGEMPAGTGLWLNNCLGEIELNRRGLGIGPPGRRLPSNMAPGVAKSGLRTLAFGSPGAERITTALHQFLLAFMQHGRGLAAAIAEPRAHVEWTDAGPRLAVEPGLQLPQLPLPVVRYPALNMYFGGVGAALYSATDGFEVAADPRREGAICVAG